MTTTTYCPKCGGETMARDGEMSVCQKDHMYPTASATATPAPVPMFSTPSSADSSKAAEDFMAAQPAREQVVALGDPNPILNDVAQAHYLLGDIRAAVGQTMAQVYPDRAGVPVMAFSILSAGLTTADQMVVYSPGGGGLRNAKQARARLKLALEQLDQLIGSGAFD